MKFFVILVIAFGLTATFEAQATIDLKEHETAKDGADLSDVDEEYIANHIYGSSSCEKCEKAHTGGTWTRSPIVRSGQGSATGSQGSH
jgi:hypothetical protein